MLSNVFTVANFWRLVRQFVFYGSILAKTVENNGNPGIHYDKRLSRQFWVAGQPMMGTFTWQRGQ